VSVDFLMPSHLYDKLKVDTFFLSCRLASIVLRQLIFRDNEVVCKIDAKLVWLNGLNKKPTKIPDNIIARFKSLEVV
ncbi:MAG: hypothetical protein CMM95_01670, partial [Rickettsiales bacterium]|nr:hypothetical protein [Rickettsiales bacterium]